MTNPLPLPTEEEQARRRSRYGRHLRAHPVRQTQVPSAFADLPDFRRLAEEREHLIQAEARIRNEAEARRRRMDAANAERAEAVRAAMLDPSKPVPPPVDEEPWPWPAYPQHVFDDLHSLLEATELGMLEEQHDALAAHLEAEAEPIRRKVDKLREQLADEEARLIPYERAGEDLALLRTNAARRGGATTTGGGRTVNASPVRARGLERYTAEYEALRAQTPRRRSRR
ncbi:hypothetical protein [Nocardioides antri]|uniref:Uncharacterized protein n=1 Tax=Nocardioides antri TaxID=2607659 RepID=A0A5B1M4M7_9ACTN|nr:hypothetical protein [Nocardioides antri]KAA1427863.1 hypothetical protein F0U47_10610 [Nocardioides antri]